MDKDMIHIDDLVRGQLSGREEDERPGAWLHMRELLDKNMPAGTPTPFNRRRLGGYIAVLSLLAVMATGGYVAMQYSGPGNDQITQGITLSPETSADPAISAPHETHSDMGSEEQSIAAKTQHDNSTGNLTASSSPATRPATGKAAQQTPSAEKSDLHGAMAAADNTNTVETGLPEAADIHPADHNPGKLKPESSKTAQAISTVYNTDITSDGNNRPESAATVQKNTVAALSPKQHDQPAETATAISQSLRLQHQAPAENLASAIPSAPQTAQKASAPHEHQAAAEMVVNSGDGYRTTQPAPNKTAHETGKNNTGTFITHKDTVQQINLVYRTVIDPLSRARTHIVDTTSVKKLIIEQQELVAATPAPPATYVPQGSENIATENNTAATDITENASAANATQSKRESRGSGRTFQDMYLNTKFKLSQAPFYIGITAGVNAMSAGGTFIPGIQLGLNGELELNEKWSVLAELKYINRFNSGKTIDDPYRGKPVLKNTYYQNGTDYRVYQRDSMNHYFNFSTIGTGNLPVMVKYSVDRFFMLAGVDLVYHFRMNAEEIDAPVTGAELRDTLLASQASSLLAGSDPSVQLSDLGARFGIGYLLGVGYKATPNLHLDLRLTHTFWDNAATGGAKKVSDQLFRIPSLQFSLGYRLGGTQRTP